MSDMKSYTQCEMIWDYISEYEIYNITLKDVAKMKIVTDQITGHEIVEEHKIAPNSLMG